MGQLRLMASFRLKGSFLLIGIYFQTLLDLWLGFFFSMVPLRGGRSGQLQSSFQGLSCFLLQLFLPFGISTFFWDSFLLNYSILSCLFFSSSLIFCFFISSMLSGSTDLSILISNAQFLGTSEAVMDSDSSMVRKTPRLSSGSTSSSNSLGCCSGSSSSWSSYSCCRYSVLLLQYDLLSTANSGPLKYFEYFPEGMTGCSSIFSLVSSSLSSFSTAFSSDFCQACILEQLLADLFSSTAAFPSLGFHSSSSSLRRALILISSSRGLLRLFMLKVSSSILSNRCSSSQYCITLLSGFTCPSLPKVVLASFLMSADSLRQACDCEGGLSSCWRVFWSAFWAFWGDYGRGGGVWGSGWGFWRLFMMSSIICFFICCFWYCSSDFWRSYSCMRSLTFDLKLSFWFFKSIPSDIISLPTPPLPDYPRTNAPPISSPRVSYTFRKIDAYFEGVPSKEPIRQGGGAERRRIWGWGAGERRYVFLDVGWCSKYTRTQTVLWSYNQRKMVKAEEGTKLLHILKPAIQVIPEIEAPLGAVSFETKQIWTGIVVLIYLLCCQIPLYGIIKSEESDPFYWMRAILASNRGTLMELGISPIVTASMIMQLLNGAKLIKVDQNNKEEKALYEGAQKLAGVVIAFGQAFAYTWSGMYGDIADVGAGNAILIVLQLTFASLVTILLDDMLGKGYGIGNSATSIFIAINMAETIIWNCFSPLSFKTKTGSTDLEQYEGAFVELLYGVWFRENKLGAIQDALFRDSLPNLSNVLGTVFVFLIVIYFQGFKISLKLANNKTTSDASYPIRLFYTSNMPIILMSALVSNVYFFSQMLYRNFKGSFITSIFGSWQEAGYQGQIVPVGGLIYYITAPRTLYEALTDPIHTVFYTLFVVGSCALFSKTWISVSGQGPREICDNLKDQGMSLKGYTNDGTYKKLKKLIETAALLGGMFTGLLTIFADFLGAIGSGTGILLSVTIIYGIYEDIVKEQASKGKGAATQGKR